MYSYTPERVYESDDELRARLRYIGAWPIAAVEQYSGPALDDLAWRFNLKRRRL